MALTKEQERALALFAEGLSTAQVAQRLGVSRPTVWRWQQELPEFAGTLEEPQRRPPLTFRDVVRIVVPVLVIALAALFFYLGYGR